MRSGAKFLSEIQKRLGIIGYHVPTEIYLQQTLLAYSANPHFPFIERINHTIHSIRQAGLYFKWREDHDEKIVKGFTGRHRQRQEIRNDDTFPVPVVVFYGWLASLFALIVELIWNK